MTYDLDFKQMTPEEDSEFNLPWHYRDDDVAIGITGKALRFLIENREMYEYELKTVLHSAQVFARMSSDEKVLLVENLKSTLKEYVGMCGDGLNDCGALKVADAGIALG